MTLFRYCLNESLLRLSVDVIESPPLTRIAVKKEEEIVDRVEKGFQIVGIGQDLPRSKL